MRGPTDGGGRPHGVCVLVEDGYGNVHEGEMVHGRRQGEWAGRDEDGTQWWSYRCTDDVWQPGSGKVRPPPLTRGEGGPAGAGKVRGAAAAPPPAGRRAPAAARVRGRARFATAAAAERGGRPRRVFRPFLAV